MNAESDRVVAAGRDVEVGGADGLLLGDSATLADRLREANAGYLRARELDLERVPLGVTFDPRWS